MYHGANVVSLVLVYGWRRSRTSWNRPIYRI